MSLAYPTHTFRSQTVFKLNFSHLLVVLFVQRLNHGIPRLLKSKSAEQASSFGRLRLQFPISPPPILVLITTTPICTSYVEKNTHTLSISAMNPPIHHPALEHSHQTFAFPLWKTKTARVLCSRKTPQRDFQIISRIEIHPILLLRRQQFLMLGRLFYRGVDSRIKNVRLWVRIMERLQHRFRYRRYLLAVFQYTLM